ncbi:MAG: SIR2 family protein [Ignavibacteria bacterium]|jgi:NAD-dependent SIR2 family protein deacetylase
MKFFEYKPRRDVVFVLGAGASHPDGVPLQKHILPMLLSDENAEIKNSLIGKEVHKFIHENFYISHEENIYPQLEAVFGFLDYFIQQNESLSFYYTNSKLINIKEYLIKLIHHIVNKETDKPSKYYHDFWDIIINENSNVSIITLNYDNLLEHSFAEFYKKKIGFIDYCTHLMNYEKGDKLKEFNFWINPRQPIKSKEFINPVSFKVLKVHGSLNWKYCNCCNQVLLTTWDRKIDLEHGKLIGIKHPDGEEYEYVCPIDGTEFQTLIMPPSFVKNWNHPILSQLFNEASREIRVAKKIVFIGYSLSNADINIKALLKKHVNDDKELIIINPKKEKKLKTNYLSLTKNIRFVKISFEELVTKKTILKKILTTN